MKMPTIGHVQAFILERLRDNTPNEDVFETYNYYFKYISRELPTLMELKQYIASDVRFFEGLVEKRQGSPIHSIHLLNFNVAKDIFINCFN